MDVGHRQYVDLTGESLWVWDELKETEERAKAQQVKIVHCCGFDSIPSVLHCI